MRVGLVAAGAISSQGIPVEVWAPSLDGGPDTLLERSGSTPTSDPIARQAAETGRRVLEYAQREFGRSSVDGRGGTFKLLVHAPDWPSMQLPGNNAYWFDDEQRIWLGDGDGVQFSALGAADDVVAHEFFHGVIDSEVKLSYRGQQGALHESFSDVLASGIDGNWQIGETVYTPLVAGDALRDLSNAQWRDWRTFPGGDDDVHAMSEIASHAAFLVSRSIGADTLRQVWYRALTTHMRAESDFSGARDATIAAARELFGRTSSQASAISDAWDAVGILAA